MDRRPSVVLHTSWRGRGITAAAPAILLALGVFGLVDAFRWFSFVVLLLGLVLALVALVDYPVVTVFGPEGVERRCLLRRQFLGWERVSTLARPARKRGRRREDLGVGDIPRTAAVARTGAAHADPGLAASTKGPLVAEIKRRPYLLCDQVESQAEYDAIVEAMREWQPALPIRASRPDATAPPTWLHKKRRGSAPDGLVDLLA